MIHVERWAYSKLGIASQHAFTRLRSLASLEGRFNVTLLHSHSSVLICIGVRLLVSRRCQHEWIKGCVFADTSGSSSVVQYALIVHKCSFLPQIYFWIQLFFPDCLIQSGKKCWDPRFTIVCWMKIARCALDCILVLYRSEWSLFFHRVHAIY